MGKKLRLGKAMKNNESVPVWVILRTNGKYKYNLMRRDWRRKRLKGVKMKEKDNFEITINLRRAIMGKRNVRARRAINIVRETVKDISMQKESFSILY